MSILVGLVVTLPAAAAGSDTAPRPLPPGPAHATVSAAIAGVGVPLSGDWEGSTRGHPASLQLVRRRGRSMVDQLVYESPACSAAPAVTYGINVFSAFGPVGPGGGFGMPPFEIGSRVLTDGYGGVFTGRRSGVLLVALKSELHQRRCRVPRFSLRWRLHPAERVSIADGAWRGAVDAAGDVTGGAVTLRFGAGGRELESISVHADASCAAGGISADAGTGLRFIPANGAFAFTFRGSGGPISLAGHVSGPNAISGTFKMSTPGAICGDDVTGGWSATAGAQTP